MQDLSEEFENKFVDVELIQLNELPYINSAKEQIGREEKEKFVIDIVAMVNHCGDQLSNNSFFKDAFGTFKTVLSKDLEVEKIDTKKVLDNIEQVLGCVSYVKKYKTSLSAIELAYKVVMLEAARDSVCKSKTQNESETGSELLALRQKNQSLKMSLKKLNEIKSNVPYGFLIVGIIIGALGAHAYHKKIKLFI